VTYTYSIRFYRIYDTGDSADLNRLEENLTNGHSAIRTNFTRVRPKSISMDVLPLLIRLPPVVVKAGDADYTLSAFARVYDIGAISLCCVLEDMNAPASTLQETALRFAGQNGLDAVYAALLAEVREIIGPHLGEVPIDAEFYEDYTIYLTDRTDDALDPVVLLLGENRVFSHQTREDILKHSLSYGDDDLTILSWDTALLVSTEPPGDLIDLIEYALVQALEFRYYDRVLTLQMNRMYDDIESVDRSSQYRRRGQYHRIMSRLLETHADLSEVTDKVDNLIKITEDIYYARVYAMALDVLHISQWRSSVNRRIEVIHQSYTMLSDEVNVQHSYFLEWVIIALITLEFAVVLWDALRVI